MYSTCTSLKEHKYIVTYCVKHKKKSICYTYFHVGNPKMRIVFYSLDDAILFIKRSLSYFALEYMDIGSITTKDFLNELHGYTIYDVSKNGKILLDKLITWEKALKEFCCYKEDIMSCDFHFAPYVHNSIFVRTSKAGWGCSKRKRVNSRCRLIQPVREISLLSDKENNEIFADLHIHNKTYATKTAYCSNKTNHKMTITGSWKRDFKCKKQWMKHLKDLSDEKLSREVWKQELKEIEADEIWT